MTDNQPLVEQLRDYMESAPEDATINSFYDHVAMPIELRSDFITAALLKQYKEQHETKKT